MLMKCNANVSIPGAMRNANAMQMKCNANKCKKMHNSGSDPISYNQLLERLENAQDHDMGMDQELYRFRAIIGHQGPLLDSDPDWKGSQYNVQVEWETGEITFWQHMPKKMIYLL